MEKIESNFQISEIEAPITQVNILRGQYFEDRLVTF